MRSSHRGANRQSIPQPTRPNVSQQRSLSTNSRIARAGEMLSTRSQVAIWELIGHAYLTSPPLPARRDESLGPVSDCALMSRHIFSQRGVISLRRRPLKWIPRAVPARFTQSMREPTLNAVHLRLPISVCAQRRLSVNLIQMTVPARVT